MLDKLFMQILDMSRIASVVILLVLLARLLLRRAPKSYSYVLWAVVLFRLLCPVTIESPVTVVPEITPVEQQYTLADKPISFAGAGAAAQQAAGDALNGGIDMQHVPTTERDEQGNLEYVSAHWWEVWVLFGTYLWLGGIAVMAIYSLYSYRKLKKQLTEAALLRENVYLVDGIGSPFVMGVLRPKIYLPSALSAQEQGYIILHEQYHIRRLDQVFKGLAFTALCLHWFNPLVWLAFVLAGKDMEMSCDEAVMREMDGDIRADYSASLLALATGRRIIAGTPLAFGEGDTKSRIRNVLGWKRPKMWVTALAAVLCVAVLAACIADPVHKTSGEYASIADYAEQNTSDTVQLYIGENPKEVNLGEPMEFPVLDRELGILKYGQLSEFAEEGILEAWTYHWRIKPDLGEIPVEHIALTSTQYMDSKGYLFLDNSRLVVALRYEDGSYDILFDEPYNDHNTEFFGYHNGVQEALYDWYVKENGLALPLYVEDWSDRIEVPEGGSVNEFPVHRDDGDGWYVYIPVSAWEFDAVAHGKQNRWVWSSAHGTDSTLSVERFMSIEDAAFDEKELDMISQEGVSHTWRKDETGITRYFWYYALEEGECWRVTAQWIDANITDDPDVAMEPQVLQLMAESFTFDERMSKSVSMVEFLSQLTADQVALMSERYTAEEVVQTIQNAMSGNVYTLDATRSSLDNAIWNMELAINAPESGGWSGDDALQLWAGLYENEVQIQGGSNLPREIILVENKELYWMVRTMQDTESRGIDQDIYETYRKEIEAYLSSKETVVSDYTRTELLTGVWLCAAEEKLGAELFNIESVGVVEPAEKAPLLLAGGAYVDSLLRIHDSNLTNILVVIDGEAVGFVNWEWLEIDKGLERCNTKEELKNEVIRAGTSMRELLGLMESVIEESPSTGLTPTALTLVGDQRSHAGRLDWLQAQIQKADNFGEVPAGEFRVSGERIAWVSKLVGSPHTGQYRLRLRYPDGGVAVLPLPWEDYPVTAIPDKMEFHGDTFVYEISFNENSYYNEGASLNHLQGTYRYTVYLAEKRVVQEILNHRKDSLIGVWEAEIPLSTIGEVADSRTVTATARYTFSADGNVTFEILPHKEGMDGQRDIYQYAPSGDSLVFLKNDSIEQHYTYQVRGDTLALAGRMNLVLQRVG